MSLTLLSPSYDANGSITGNGTDTFAYNDANRLSQVSQGANPPTASYIYDAQGRRTLKDTAGGSAPYRHFDQDGNLIAETDAAGNLVKAYVWLEGQPLAQIAADGSARVNENETPFLRNYARLFFVEGGFIQAAFGKESGAGILFLNRFGCFAKADARTDARFRQISFARP